MTTDLEQSRPSTGAGAFTPGPWCVEDPMGDGPGDSLWIVTQVKGGEVYNWRCIALVSDDTDPKSDQPPIYVRQRDANARLIAAAPDLYEALENLLIAAAMVDEPTGFDDDADRVTLRAGMFHQARAALAKARGQ